MIVAGDNELTYSKVAYATFLLHANRDIVFVSTNQDATFPSTKRVFPGSGSSVAALTTAVQRDPVNVGKPEPFLLELMSELHHLQPERTLFVGDRLDTDIAFGKRAGFQTALVLTGVTHLEHLETLSESQRPDYVIESVAQLI